MQASGGFAYQRRITCSALWESDRSIRKMKPLYRIMIKVAECHDIKVPQVAMAFCSTKGVVPMCGCRKPEQVEELAQAAKIRLTKGEVRRLEEAADKVNVKIMGADLFRPFVLKERRSK
ncbi:MAG: aldo/keto reductase [Eubacterium sp.]|nr:aldo/keto reductase [Eubacterium sp.]